MKKVMVMVNGTLKLLRSIFTTSKVIGTVNITLRDKNGNIKESDTHNLIVTSGKEFIADQLSGNLLAAMSHMSIGTGTIAASLPDTALGTEISRKAYDSKTQGAGSDANKVVHIVTWSAGEGTGAITEAGMFNAATSGTMLCRTVFAVKNKGVDDTLALTWTITVN